MSIRRRKLKSGRVVFDATLEYGNANGTRERRTKTFDTLKAAQDAEKEAKRYRDAVADRSGKLKLAEYIDKHYWPIASRCLASTSVMTYEKEMRLRIKPYLGEYYLDALDRRKIQAMVDNCETESVARKAVATLKTILNEAVADGYLTANPTLARFAYPPKGRKRDNGLILGNFADIAQFIAVVQNDALESITRLVMSGLMIGLRPEERYGLNYEDFDFANGTVSVQRAYIVAPKELGGVQLKDTKTELSHRIIPMPQAFIDWFYFEPDEHGPWITNKHGERLSPVSGRHMWSMYLDNHPELPRVTLENMRHSFATACLNAGMHVEDLSRMLGHADINTTFRRYVKPDLANIRAGLAKIPYE